MNKSFHFDGNTVLGMLKFASVSKLYDLEIQ